MDLAGLLQSKGDDSPSGENLEYDPLFTEMELAGQPGEESQIGDEVKAAEDPDYRDLKEKSLTLLERDPFESLVAAAGELSNTSRQVISRGLDRMLRVLAARHGKKVFGMCPDCRYLRTGMCCTGNETEYQCELNGEPLREPEIRQLCVNFASSR